MEKYFWATRRVQLYELTLVLARYSLFVFFHGFFASLRTNPQYGIVSENNSILWSVGQGWCVLSNPQYGILTLDAH
jgi:hypothetical protein